MKGTKDIRRHVVLTANGKAEAVLIDARTYNKHLSASNLSSLLLAAEQDVLKKRVRPMRFFLLEFKNARKVAG